ncbi:MAG: DUF21 domain-containing protein [Planctomycetales bacterium]|nr:DUF21 domain-containing protein [Planctomycetales bacterium]
MIVILLLLVVGLLLSAFYSGSETGFYRATRVRLVLDSRSGDWISRGLLWLTNNPALFVATTLIGNNLANYLTSLGTVLLAQRIEPAGSHFVDLIAPVLFTPIVFVYGELLPKNLFFHAPNRLLRLAGPPFLLCTVAFLPISGLLWVFGRVLQRLLGSTPLRVRLTLARRELRQVIVEGKEAGLLHGVQQRLIENLFETASDPIAPFVVRLENVTHAPLNASRRSVLELAKTNNVDAVCLFDPHSRELVGYVRLADLYLDESPLSDSIQLLPRIAPTEPVIAALIRLETSNADMGQVVDRQGKTMGIVFTRQLTVPLFDGV